MTDRPKLYDLVRTEDGYYGIVVGPRDVFTGNGLQPILEDTEWEALTVIPMNIFHENGPPANFLELFENRTPAQQGFPPKEPLVKR